MSKCPADEYEGHFSFKPPHLVRPLEVLYRLGSFEAESHYFALELTVWIKLALNSDPLVLASHVQGLKLCAVIPGFFFLYIGSMCVK